MKRVKQLITGKFLATVAFMGLMAVCYLSATMPLRSWGANKKVIEKGAASWAFLGLVATFKKNKSWEGMDEASQKFAEGMDVVLKEFATNETTQEKMTEQLEAFEKKHGAGILDEGQQKDFKETVAAVKAMALEIQKLKDNGFVAEEVLPFNQAFAKSLKENAENLKNLKGKQKETVEMTFKAAAAMSTSNVSANTVANMPGQPAMVMPGLASAPRNEPFILDFVDNGTTSSTTIQWFNKVNREDGTAMVAEGALKPLSDFDIVGETSAVKKIAHGFNVSEEALADIPMLQSELNGEGITSLMLGIEDQILNGSGAGDNLKGILTYAGAYSLAALNDTVNNANEYDAILAAHTMLATLNYKPNAVFVNPVTRFKLRTTKDANGNYIIPPSSDANALNIDGLPIIAKNQITAGNFLMGDFKKSHVRFYMDVTIRVGYHDDDFRKNRVTVLIEARLTHFIKDVETSAFVDDSFATVMAALESAAAE